jgi:uncharacterized DUF497 family protein
MGELRAERLMNYFQIIWDDEESVDGNVQHIAEHGLTIEDVEYVLENPSKEVISNSTGQPCCFGFTPSGEYIIVVYEQIDNDTIYPITAYEVSES